MMNKERVSKDQIRQARQANLAEYLLAAGEPIIKEGGYYTHRDHDSLKIKDNAYYWNSRSEHGNALDYLVRHMGLSFSQAVVELIADQMLGNLEERPQTKSDQLPFSWGAIETTLDLRRSFAYLTKKRMIASDIISDLVKKRLLFQEETSNNIIFPIYDDLGEIVGAELQGTLSDKRFKGIKTGSKYGYGYNISMSTEIGYLMFFESAVDLISFIEIERLRGKPIHNCRLISLAGLKEPIFKASLERQKGGFKPVLCVDNDLAGSEFINAVQGKCEGVRVFQPESQFKDWNEQLIAMKKSSK